MTHDEFVGQVQHRAHLPSRGDAERIIRSVLETLSERLQPSAADHLASQLPPEIARHLRTAPAFQHLTVHDFFVRVAHREQSDVGKATFHVHAVLETIGESVSPGAMKKLMRQLPEEYHSLFTQAAAV